MDAGQAVPDDCCSVEMCVLSEFNALPNSQTWRWMAELLEFESAGVMTLQKQAREWSIQQLRAFVKFRATITEIEQDRAKKDAEWNARNGGG